MSLIAEKLVPEGALFADRYQVEALLGQGGMGAVYAAFDPVMKRRVALKRLSGEARPHVMALFEREYQTLASLKHPRIVEVFEFGRASEGAYYTMELLEGADLSQAAPMPWREVCACLRDAASILGVLHVRKLVHRDLSPRNLWRTPDGRLKLLDFGALAPFGVAKEAMGTPPFVPPEALRGLPLDQRSDLFALGALGYWLLTSVHAYPAKSMGELHTLWTREPASPSNLVALLGGNEEPLPKALEELLHALLRLDPAQRLSSTAELIDRVCALAELPPEGNELAAQGYLESKVFVGRTRERERLLHHITQAELGEVQALMIEGAPGIGRTRLLEEMAIITRVAGALTVKLDAQLGATPYGLAATVVEQLIAASPEAHACAMEHATVLGTLSATLQVALGCPSRPPIAQRPGEPRQLVQSALREVVLSVTADRLLALLVDDVHEVDEESQALLSALARGKAGNKLLLVTTVQRDGSAELRPLAQSLRDASVHFRLLALTRSETQELLRSVFGNAPYLERLAERFHRLSEGNPSHCLELSQHLVRVGAAHYAEGMWVLPTDLAGTNLPKSRSEGILGRLSLLSKSARKLAAQLSVPHAGPVPSQVALEVASQSVDNAGELLGELVGASIVSASPAGYAFTHEVLRETLLGELTSSEREAAHLRLGEALLRHDPDSRSVVIAAGLHFMRGGDIARGERLQVAMARQSLDSPDFEALRNDAPLLEQGLTLLKAQGRGDHALVAHLSILTYCGYFVERGYGERHGDETLATLGRVLKLPLAIKLRRILGGRLSLLVALSCAAISIALRGSGAASLQTTIRWLFSAVLSLSAASAVCIDSKAGARYAAALAPFAVLGDKHPAGFIYRYACHLSKRSQDHVARTACDANALITRLRDRALVRSVPEDLVETFLSGALFSLGVTESWRDGPEGLRTAD